MLTIALPALVVLLGQGAGGVTPVDVEAARIEWTADRISATGGLVLSHGGLRLEAEGVTGGRTRSCPAGDLRVSGPVRLSQTPPPDVGPAAAPLSAVSMPGAHHAEAAAVTLCVAEGGEAAVHAEGLTLRGPRLRLSAVSAERKADGSFALRDLRATPCTCDPPPWEVGADSAEIIPGRGAWAEWPVLRVASVPILTAPAAYLPLAERETGFLLPTGGWDAEDGAYGALPFFWAPHRSVDLTVAPGWRGHRGLTSSGRLRWAADATRTGALAVDALPEEGALVTGEGQLPLGPLRLSVDGEWASDRGVRRALAPGLDRRGRDHTRGDVGLSATGARIGGGARLASTQDLRSPAALPGQPGVTTLRPELWTRWHADHGPAALWLDSRLLRLDDGRAPADDLLDVVVGLRVPTWLGPVRLDPVAAFSTVIHGGEASGQRLAGWTGGTAEVVAGRMYGASRHTMTLRLDGRWAAAGSPYGGDGLPAARLPLHRPLDSRSGGATLETRWIGPAASALLSVRGSYEGAEPVGGAEPLQARLLADTRWLGVEGRAAGTEAASAHTRLGPDDGWHGRVGVTRTALAARTPWLRPGPTERPVLMLADVQDGTTVDTALTGAVGPLRATWLVVTDPERPAVLGQRGHLTWRSACQCWTATLSANHERGRPAPDVWLAVGLSAW